MQMDTEKGGSIHFFSHSNLYLIVLTNLSLLFQYVDHHLNVYLLNILYDLQRRYGNYVYYLKDIYMIFFFLDLLVNPYHIGPSFGLSSHLLYGFVVLV